MSSTLHNSLPRLSNRQTKVIKSLRLKKYRQQENAFLVEGTKNVTQLLAADLTIQMLIGTAEFLETHQALWHGKPYDTFLAEKQELAALGALSTNHAAVAVASVPEQHTTPPPADTWGLVLDNISDPGNLGTIIRIADWYNIPTLVCAPTTVDLYNPKVLQASMGSFLRVKIHYTPLAAFLSKTPQPIMGTFTQGDNLHHITWPPTGWIVIGNESQGIGEGTLPYIQRRITIPRYGQAESLNAAIATAVVCDRWQQAHFSSASLPTTASSH